MSANDTQDHEDSDWIIIHPMPIDEAPVVIDPDEAIDYSTELDNIEREVKIPAHVVPYKLDKLFDSLKTDKIFVKQLDTSGAEQLYTAMRVSTSNLGLIPYILTPISMDDVPVGSESVDVYSWKYAIHEGGHRTVEYIEFVEKFMVKNISRTKHNNVQVLFKGTNPKSGSALARDLFEQQPGSGSLFANAKDIIAALEKRAEDMSNINLSIAGHSLGGADAQNFFAAILVYIAEKNLKDGQKSTIREVTLNHANAAGATKDTVDLCAMAAKYCVNKLGLKLRMNIIHAGGDPVQPFGHKVLHDAGSDIVETKLAKINFDDVAYRAARADAAHRSHVYLPDGNSYVISNDTDADRLKISAKLQNTFIVGDSYFVKIAKLFISTPLGLSNDTLASIITPETLATLSNHVLPITVTPAEEMRGQSTDPYTHSAQANIQGPESVVSGVTAQLDIEQQTATDYKHLYDVEHQKLLAAQREIALLKQQLLSTKQELGTAHRAQVIAEVGGQAALQAQTVAEHARDAANRAQVIAEADARIAREARVAAESERNAVIQARELVEQTNDHLQHNLSDSQRHIQDLRDELAQEQRYAAEHIRQEQSLRAQLAEAVRHSGQQDNHILDLLDRLATVEDHAGQQADHNVYLHAQLDAAHLDAEEQRRQNAARQAANVDLLVAAQRYAEEQRRQNAARQAENEDLRAQLAEAQRYAEEQRRQNAARQAAVDIERQAELQQRQARDVQNDHFNVLYDALVTSASVSNNAIQDFGRLTAEIQSDGSTNRNKEIGRATRYVQIKSALDLALTDLDSATNSLNNFINEPNATNHVDIERGKDLIIQSRQMHDNILSTLLLAEEKKNMHEKRASRLG